MTNELIDLLNRRPAMNAGLDAEYAAWNDECYRVMGALSQASANDGKAQEHAAQLAGQGQDHVFTTASPELNDLLRETTFLAGEGANMDDAMLWHESLERVLALLSAPSAPVQAQGCTRSHPHENMTPMCELRTEIARLNHAAAIAQAQKGGA